jgi:hypothetical protein
VIPAGAFAACALRVSASLTAGLAAAQDSVPEGWTALAPLRMESQGGAQFAAQPDGSLLVQGASAETDVFTLELEGLPPKVTALRIEALPDAGLARAGPGRSDNGNFVLTELRAYLGVKGDKRPRAVALTQATASFSQTGLPATSAIDGVPSTGWAIHPNVGVAHHLVVETREDLEPRTTQSLVLELEFGNGSRNTIGRLRALATGKDRPVRADLPEAVESWGRVQERVNLAIDRGCEWLLAQQKLDGSWDADIATYRNGGTALVAYALLKSKVPKGHPAIVRALEFMRCIAPRETYVLGCQLMALDSLEDPSVEPWIGQLAQTLLSQQQPNGGFHYGLHGATDLSNTQYGALGLRIAAKHGVRIQAEVWDELAAYVLARSDDQGGGAYAPIGFKYAPDAAPTGSMTAAGIGVLAICDLHLKGRSQHGSLLGIAKRGGQWLGENFTVETNPRADAHWLYYYLYGMERVGALLETEEFGGHRWYREGARWLVDHQEGDGKWGPGGNGAICSTSWALLFLTRATNPVSGVSPRRARSYGEDDPSEPISIRASGDTPLTFWISTWGQAELDAYTWPQDGDRGLRVKRVEWFAVEPGASSESRVIALEKDGLQPCGRERFAAQHAFKLPGAAAVFARATLMAPPESGAGPEVVVESEMLSVRIEEAMDPELLEYAGDAGRNLLIAQKPYVHASSFLDDGRKPERAIDGLLVLGWASKDDDPRPRLTIELEKPVRANALQLLPLVIDAARPAITKLAVTLNGKGPPIPLDLRPEPDRKTRLVFPQATVVRRIEIDVTEVTDPDAIQKSVGLAEVELQMAKGGSKRN